MWNQAEPSQGKSLLRRQGDAILPKDVWSGTLKYSAAAVDQAEGAPENHVGVSGIDSIERDRNGLFKSTRLLAHLQSVGRIYAYESSRSDHHDSTGVARAVQASTIFQDPLESHK
jgi:hypothetical protein